MKFSSTTSEVREWKPGFTDTNHTVTIESLQGFPTRGH